MKCKVKYGNYPEMTYHLSTWFPFFSQGFSLGFWTCVKYVYYKDTKVISTLDTEDVIKHEYSHFVLYKTKYTNWFKFIWAYIGYKMLLWFLPHSKFPFEIEANKIKMTLSDIVTQNKD